MRRLNMKVRQRRRAEHIHLPPSDIRHAYTANELPDDDERRHSGLAPGIPNPRHGCSNQGDCASRARSGKDWVSAIDQQHHPLPVAVGLGGKAL